MFETLESRQLFSVAVGASPLVETAPPPAVGVEVGESKKPKPRPTETVRLPYATTALEYGPISS
jgi:hypothetical protein